jgi:macrolide phosphotransferase
MSRTPLVLAALASAAVPGLDPVSVSRPDVEGMDHDVALVTDDRQRRWVVRAPRRPAAAATLDAEHRLLPLLSRHLPVPVPAPAGRAVLPEGGTALVHPWLPGRPLDVTDLVAGSPLTAQLGRVIGALHEVDVAVADEAGLASYGADEYRRRRLGDVDRAARTGRVPAALLAHWERELERVDRWRFAPVLVHGDLAGEHVLVDGGEVSAVIDWGEACVADPADDLAWLAVSASPEAFDTVLEAYAMVRTEGTDRDLASRAHLAAELALARWLLGGLAAGDDQVVRAATAAMADLADRLPDDAHATSTLTRSSLSTTDLTATDSSASDSSATDLSTAERVHDVRSGDPASTGQQR